MHEFAYIAAMRTFFVLWLLVIVAVVPSIRAHHYHLPLQHLYTNCFWQYVVF